MDRFATPVACRRGLARLFGALAFLTLALAGPVTAAAPAAGGAAVAPAATPAASPPAGAVAAGEPTIQQLEAMASTLENPEARAKLVEQLRALVAAQKGLTPAKPPEPEATLPQTLGARALGFLADHMDVVSRQLVQVGDIFADLPGTVAWINRQMEDSSARDRWSQIGYELLLILGVGGTTAWGIWWLLGRPHRALAARVVPSPLMRIPRLLARAALELVPIVAFIVIAYTVLSVTEPGTRVRLVVLAVINASVIVQALLIVVGMLVAPGAPHLRLIRAGEAGARRAYVWIRRLIAAAVYGYFLAEGAYVLGLPLGAYGALLKLLGVLIAGMLIVLILQNRASVAAWMHGNPLSGDGDPDATAERESEGQGAVLRSARRRFADIWHVLAIAYVSVTLGVWVLNVYGGFEYLARATAITIVSVVVARLLVTALNRGLRRSLTANRDLRGSLPQLYERTFFYLPILQRVGKTLIWLVALGVVLDGWGIDSLAWTESALGRHIVGSVLSISLLLSGAVVAWEVVSALIEHFLTSTDHDGTRIERSARVRTLLPLLRNAFLILLVTMVSLITLSELGVNIAPLLAAPASSAWPSVLARKVWSRTSSPACSFCLKTRCRSAIRWMSAAVIPGRWRPSPSARSGCATAPGRCIPCPSAPSPR